MNKNNIKKIGILTSGGDAPGMNAAIRGATRCAISRGMEMLGILDGYRGIIDRQFRELEWHDVARIIHRGGTILGTGRFPEFLDPAVRKQAVEILRENGVGGLVVIGGNGSLTGGYKIWTETGFPVVGIPGTIDNDLYGTDFALGTDTALNIGVNSIDILRDTAASHNRVFIVEMFGNRSGYLAINSGLASGVIKVIIPEEVLTEKELDELSVEIAEWLKKMKRSSSQIESSRHAIIVISEGARFAEFPGEGLDSQLHKINTLKEHLNAAMSEFGGECRTVVLGHLQRGGHPSAFDRIGGTRMGAFAVRVLVEKGGGYMVGLMGKLDKIVDLKTVVEKSKEIQEVPHRNLELRGLGMTLKTQRELAGLEPAKAKSSKKRRIMLLTSGADAPGMNMGIRAIVRWSLSRGLTVLGVRHGFSPLLEGNKDEIHELDWEAVHIGLMISTGGSVLGTTRTRKITEEQVRTLWETAESMNADGIVVMGGIHAQWVCHNLMKSPLKMPLIFIPATISNNIPGTDISIGSDTALNNLVMVIDKTKDTGISLRRIHIINVLGRECGWLALKSALAGGAEDSFDPESGMHLERVVEVADYLRKAFKRPGKAGQRTGILMLNEMAGKIFNGETISQIMTDRTGRTSRTLDPGQMQRGGPPTAFDRILACNLSLAAVQHINKCIDNIENEAYITGWKDGKVVITCLNSALEGYREGEGKSHSMAIEEHELLNLVSRRPE